MAIAGGCAPIRGDGPGYVYHGEHAAGEETDKDGDKGGRAGGRAPRTMCAPRTISVLQGLVNLVRV
eukprot:2349979-Lingulodinium_polyedra.AAC.1